MIPLPGLIQIASGGGNLPIIPVDTSRTLALSDKDALLVSTFGSPQTLSFATNATVPFPVGAQILFVQNDAGAITFLAIGGVQLRTAPGKTFTTNGLGSFVSAIQLAIDEWRITGDLVPS